MSDEVLVAFATDEEPTHAVAAAIAEVLREGGTPVTVEPLEAVGGIRRFRGLVLGTAIHDRTWLPGLGEFLLAHQRDAEMMPIWVFATGPTDAWDKGTLEEPPAALVKLLERVGLRDLVLFAGSLQPHHLAAGLRALSAITRTTVDDHRDWQAGRRWAAMIRDGLPAVTPRAPSLLDTDGIALG